jgi:hypothetical protein
VERQRVSFATGVKYAALEPTDLVTLHGMTVRINKRTEEGLLLRWEGVNDASQIYLQTWPGATTDAGDQTPPVPIPTTALYLDIPLLRDVDDTPGFYLAANGTPTEGWPGTQIYKSTDSGATYSAYQAITAPATFGLTLTLLGDWQQVHNIFDEANTVDVQVNGELTSTTELAVLNGANHMLIGSEVVQFKVAELIDTATYRLSGLLRGRLGTEWANGTHTLNDRAVLLNANLRNATQAQSEITLTRRYNAVTFGMSFESGTQTDFANNGVRHEPYAPHDLGGGRQVTNDWQITWKRRTRLSDGWQDLIDAPLGETTESYEVDIMSGATVKRTLTSSTQSVTYTSAQQVTDFGSAQSTVSVRVYQLSSVTGRGYPGVATLPSVAPT